MEIDRRCENVERWYAWRKMSRYNTYAVISFITHCLKWLMFGLSVSSWNRQAQLVCGESSTLATVSPKCRLVLWLWIHPPFSRAIRSVGREQALYCTYNSPNLRRMTPPSTRLNAIDITVGTYDREPRAGQQIGRPEEVGESGSRQRYCYIGSAPYPCNHA